ncbi:ABC transporter permease [Paenibacillus faecalis]|uniref:ABC transporter permease n=1 Tax=Paenibacillus faecalis TaxID=2079532 RepID=UPI000D0F8E7D|nr:ABC transporter permease [Paenibacillus faecalis]
MKIWSIALKDLRVILKDKQALALIILMPIVLILVLGLSLNSMFSGSEAKMEAIEVGFVDLDGSDDSKSIKSFLESDSLSSYIHVTEMKEQEALEKVKNGDLASAVIVPENYSSNIEDGGRAQIRLYEDKGNELESSIVGSIMNNYAGMSSAMLAAADAAGSLLTEYTIPGESIVPALMESISYSESVVSEGNITGDSKGLSAIQYYSAAVVSMYILFVGMLGTTSIIEEREDQTLRRLLTTKAGKAEILTGKFVGLTILGIMDVAILILFTKYVFRVEWGNSLAGLIVLSLAMTFAASGLAMLLATLFKTSKTADIVNPAVIMLMAFVGGNMMPIYDMHPVLQNAANMLLNNWALKGYLNLMVNNGFSSIITPSIVLCSMGVVFLSLGISRLKLQ